MRSTTGCHGAASCRRRPPSAAAVSLGGITAACNAIGGQQGGTFNWMTWGDHYIDDPAQGHRDIRQDRGPDQRTRRERRGLRQAQGGEGPARHDLGRRPVGARCLLRRRAHRAVRHQRAEGRLAALSVRARVRDLDEARGLPRVPVRLVADQHLLQRGPGQPAPDSWEVLLDRSTRAGSSSRTSPRRSSPTWARRPGSTTSTT